MTREISRKAAVWRLYAYVYIYKYTRCGASLAEKVGKMLGGEILIQRFKGCSFATVINARFKLGVVARGYAINISIPPLSLPPPSSEQRLAFENGIVCGPSGWRYVGKVENEVCQTPHFYTFFFTRIIYPKNIHIHLVIPTPPSPRNSTVPG